MTPELFLKILVEWKKRLKLDHYRIEVIWDEPPEDEDAFADIEVSDLYDEAQIRVRDDLSEFGVEHTNRVVVHELLHVVFFEYEKAAKSISHTGALSHNVRVLWYDRLDSAEEAVVDRLARRLVELGGIVQ